MIGRLLERGKHHHAILHLRHTESSDSQNLALYGELFSEHHKMLQRILTL